MDGEQAKAIIKSTTGLDPTETSLAIQVAKELITALQQATAVRWKGWQYDD